MAELKKSIFPKAIDRSTLNLPPTKECGSCEETKPSDDFGIDRGAYDNLYWKCKECVKESRKITEEKKLAYKPFTNILVDYVSQKDFRKLHALVKRVYETAMSDLPQAVTAQKLLIERIDGKLKETHEVVADDSVKKLVSDANELVAQLKAEPIETDPDQELTLPVEHLH